MAASLPHGTGTQENLEDCQSEVQHPRAQVKTRPVIDQAKVLLIAKQGAPPSVPSRRWSKVPKPDSDKSRCR
jgi:hypothetical protein